MFYLFTNVRDKKRKKKNKTNSTSEEFFSFVSTIVEIDNRIYLHYSLSCVDFSIGKKVVYTFPGDTTNKIDPKKKKKRRKKKENLSKVWKRSK